MIMLRGWKSRALTCYTFQRRTAIIGIVVQADSDTRCLAKGVHLTPKVRYVCVSKGAISLGSGSKVVGKKASNITQQT